MVYDQSNFPSAWFGTTQINAAPWRNKTPTFDLNPNIIIPHTIVGGLQQNNESIGYGQPQIKFNGMVSDTTALNTPINATYPFTFGTGYLGRPIAVGWFTLDFNNPQPFYSGVGYAT